jgi:hypothetical protein
MANTTANDSLVPFSMQPGRIDDFVNGMRDAHPHDHAILKSLGVGVGVVVGLKTWSAFHRYLKAS